MSMPVPKIEIDIARIVDAAEELIDMYSTNYHEDRVPKYDGALIDEALGAIYGDEVFEWINTRTP